MYNLDPNDLTDNETLITLLYGNTSELFINQMVELNKALSTSEFTSQQDVIDLLEVRVDADEMDSLEIPCAIDEIMREAAREALLSCGIQYDEEIDAETLISLTWFGLHFDVTENPQRIIDLIESADDDDDAFFKVIEECTGISYDIWMTVITDIGYGLIERMKDLAHEELENQGGITSSDKEYSLQLQQRLETIQTLNKDDQDTSVVPIQGLSEQPNFESMYVMALPELLDKPMEVVVNKIYAMSALCSDSMESMDVRASALLDDFYPDINVRMNAEQFRPECLEKYSQIKW